MTFEELGADSLMVDEAHNFKNLMTVTKMHNIAGISTTESQKASDLFMKCQYLDEITGARGVTFATGTPISNSMTELYTMQRYLQQYTLERNGLANFDSWAATFGETVTAIELAPEGTGYRTKTRFARFFNLPELMAMFKECADIQTADVYCEVMFSEEISGELPEHNRFIHETAIPYFEQRGIPTRVLRSEKTYLSCFYHVVTRGKTKGMLSGFPLSGRCTIQRDCKLPPIKAYQKALPPDTVQYIGIAADEPKRLARLKPGQISLLDKYHVAEPEARSMCAAEGLLSPLYDFTKRGGCWFCPNASISELRHLYRYHPELWQLLLELQDVPNKPTERFSWRRTFREIDERFRQEGEQLSFYEER